MESDDNDDNGGGCCGTKGWGEKDTTVPAVDAALDMLRGLTEAEVAEVW
jgi:hypothetical protein